MKWCDFSRNLDAKQKGLDDRIDAIGWALFFVMIGILLLMPEGRVPETAWLIGAGLIMLGENAVRYFNCIRMVRFTNVMGILALFFGIGGLIGATVPVFPVLLIILGVSIILGQLIKKKK